MAGVLAVGAAVACVFGVTLSQPPARPQNSIYPDPSSVAVARYVAANAPRPYLGWSSWSMQSSSYPGLNPRGPYSWLTEANVLTEADAISSTLGAHGYDYVNIDAGWSQTWSWVPEFDAYGRPAPDPARFPDGIASVVQRIHALHLKVGLYLPVGLPTGAYDADDYPIYGAPGCSTRDIVYPDLRRTSGWNTSYKIDFRQPCAQQYVDSIATEFAAWGVDFLKLDGVGPGSGRSDANHDNRPDVRAWAIALTGTGRHVQLMLSWALDRGHVADWRATSNGWRIDNDIECYCETLVHWSGSDQSVRSRFSDAPAWASDAGPGGWNNLDSLDVGNGAMDGLTEAERQSYMTLWAVEASPLYTGDDVAHLDAYGRSLLTNDEVLAIDRDGHPARPVSTATDDQTWWAKLSDGSDVVAQFNLGSTPAVVSFPLGTIGISHAAVRDIWRHVDLAGDRSGLTSTLPAHGSALYRLQVR